MTNHYFLALAAVLTTLPASGAVPFHKGLTPPRAHSLKVSAPTRAESSTLLYEDFSKFTGGTEDTPGEEITYVDSYHIPDELTSTPGWIGGGIFPTAGSIALMEREGLDKIGFISTPPLDLGGTATLTFRARTLPGHSGGSLWVALCDDYYGPGEDQEDFSLTEEWAEYTIVATQGSLEDPSYFQIQAENGYVQIDDIKLDFKRDRILSPQPYRALNVSPTEFVARWEDTGAPCYRLNVLCKTQPEVVERGSVVESFDNININDDGKTINTGNPNYPDGWEIALSSSGTQDVSTDPENLNSAPVSLFFDAVGDVITSPETPLPIDGLKFWVRPSTTEEDPEILSLLKIEIFHSLSGKWEAIAQLPYYWMSENGDFYQFDPMALGDDATRVKMSMIQRGNIDFYVDDVTLSYSTRGETTKFIEDLDLEVNEYTVSNIKPENEYSYYVQAIDGDLISEPSYTIWVDGIEGLKPKVLEATDITDDSFTANWMPLGHATDYRVETSFIVSAETDMPGVVVNEENFNGITQEGFDWQSPYNFADKGMTQTGWSATQPVWKPGMAGTQGTSWIGAAGLVFSPYLNLSGNNNEGFDVEATVETTVASVSAEDGTVYNEGIFVMILNTPQDTQALCSAYFETPTVGSHSATVHVPNPDGVDLSNVIVAFMNVTGKSFFVDDVKIMQDLKAGDELTAPYSVNMVTNDTHVSVNGLQPGRDHAYTVTASASRNYENYVSDKSDEMFVPNPKVGVNNIDASENGVAISSGIGYLSVDASDGTLIEIFSAAGLKIAGKCGSITIYPSPGIYIVKAGDTIRKVAVK